MTTELQFIQDYADGKIELGKQWGCPKLDRHWLWKRNFTIVLGHSGIGKTKLILYLELAAAIKYGHKVLIYTSENNSAVVKMELIEVLAGQSIRYNGERKLSKEETERWYAYLSKYALFIKQDKVYAWNELRGVIDHLVKKDSSIASVVIDPYNSLRIDKGVLGSLSTHDYHYEVASDMRVMSEEWKCRLVVNMHPATEAGRRFIKDNKHPYFNYADFPRPSDAEQGAKWKNRADDFIILHRIYNHPTDGNLIFIKVDKIKEQFSGGCPTPIDAENFGIVASWNFVKHRFQIDNIDILANLLNKQEQPIDDFRPEITGDFEEPEPVVEANDLPF